MADNWTCPNCKYEWPVSAGAVPETAACPRCGEEVKAVAEAIADAAQAAEG